MYPKIIIVSLIVSLIAGTIGHIAGLHSVLAAYPEFLGHFALALPATLVASAWACRGNAAPAPRRAVRRAASSSSSSGASASAAPSGARKETGSVKWFSPSKGFGFITRDNGEDIFVHFRSIMGNGHRVLREGQRVEFAVTEGNKGLQADEVCTIK